MFEREETRDKASKSKTAREKKQQETRLGETLKDGSRNQTPWQLNVARVGGDSVGQGVVADMTHRIGSWTSTALEGELRRLSLAHLSKLANDGEYMESGEKIAKQAQRPFPVRL